MEPVEASKFQNWGHSKGQLISKCPYEKSVLSNIPIGEVKSKTLLNQLC